MFPFRLTIQPSRSAHKAQVFEVIAHAWIKYCVITHNWARLRKTFSKYNTYFCTHKHNIFTFMNVSFESIIFILEYVHRSLSVDKVNGYNSKNVSGAAAGSLPPLHTSPRPKIWMKAIWGFVYLKRRVYIIQEAVSIGAHAARLYTCTNWVHVLTSPVFRGDYEYNTLHKSKYWKGGRWSTKDKGEGKEHVRPVRARLSKILLLEFIF